MHRLRPLSPEEHAVIRLAVIDEGGLHLLQELLNSWDNNDWECDPALVDQLQQHPVLKVFAPLLETNLNPIPLRSLLRVLIGRFDANLAVLEDPYLEMEFWDTYAYFHSRSFRDRRKQCWRLHFFRFAPPSDDVTPKSLIDGLYSGVSQEALDTQGFHYLGFATLRPTRSFSLGRSAIPFDEQPGERAQRGEDDSERTGVPYCKGKAPQICNVCATRLIIPTVPFLQQDPVVGMCATASLWVTSQVLASKFDLHKYPYIDISRQATQPTLAPFIATPPDNNEDFAHGLSVPEVCGALLRTGAVPLVITPRSFSATGLGRGHVQDQLYTFVESELPVIVCVTKPRQRTGHAVTAVGHLQRDIQCMSDISDCLASAACSRGSHLQHLVSLTVERYYVHNDAYGPFDRLDFIDPDEVPEEDREVVTCPVRLSRNPDVVYDIKSLVVPIPPYVKNRPDFVLQDASVRFGRLFTNSWLKNSGLRALWRMLLVKGSRFKQSLIEREWPEVIQRKYASLHLPKYIWLCEISLVSDANVGECLGAGGQRRVQGEFVYDTTTPHYTTNVIVQRLGPFFVTDPNAPMLSAAEKGTLMRQSALPGVGLLDALPCFTGSAQG